MARWALFIIIVIQGMSWMDAKPGLGAEIRSTIVLGTTFVLKEEKKTIAQYLAEYVPEGEDLRGYSKMFAIWGLLDGSDAQSQVRAKIQFVKSRQGKDPVANYNLFQSNDKKMFGLDFLISESGLMEHNIWTFQNVKGGVLAYQYVRRHYEGKSAQSGSDFIREIPSVRDQVLKFFNTSTLPRPEGYK
jgi:hypothetical protein